MAEFHAEAASPPRIQVRVRGTVQGVGFRPFVWRLARELDLAGWVRNDAEGVLLEIEGVQVSDFLDRLRRDAPPASRIAALETRAIAPLGGTDFAVRASARGEAAGTAVAADMATCDACLAELFDPSGRRWRHPFISCTDCGPRYTITQALPYDRAATSMAAFAMCPQCQAEYDDPRDRRFHAQPNACPECGPRLSMDVEEIVARIRRGEIVGLKGIGGFHLACDAANDAAVARLRARKERDAKPFAVMVTDLASAREHAEIDAASAVLLRSRARPIVIVPARTGSAISPKTSAGLPTLGLMLPYTPLHHLLLHEAAGRPAGTAWTEEPQPLALVMTSANPSGAPLVADDEEAEARLADIADAVVHHDRAIVARCDDSVMRMVAGAPTFIRRARGYAPEPIKLARPVPPVLAVGGHLKTTVCLTRGDEAFLSPHIGDLEDVATYDAFRETVERLTTLLGIAPVRVACDLHPEFLSTRFAEETGLPVTRIQHHHAHVAAVLAEHHIETPTLGLALDGFGLGEDGRSAWGGELLRVDGARFDRLGRLRPLRQPGGDAAARAPWRMGAAALHALGRGEEIAERFDAFESADAIAHMLARELNAPETSSCGRLFDAACGLLGVTPIARYAGEAAMALEALVRAPRVLADGWRVDKEGALDLTPLLAALVDCEPRAGAELFHGTLAAALVDWTVRALDESHVPRRVALSGGCLMNAVLAERLVDGLAACGVEALLARQAPPNDGGLALGQAWVAALEEMEAV